MVAFGRMVAGVCAVLVLASGVVVGYVGYRLVHEMEYNINEMKSRGAGDENVAGLRQFVAKIQSHRRPNLVVITGGFFSTIASIIFPQVVAYFPAMGAIISMSSFLTVLVIFVKPPSNRTREASAASGITASTSRSRSADHK